MSEDQKRNTDEIKVTDRRSFTQAGERRAPDQPKTEAKREKPAPAARSEDAATASDPHAIGFENFIRYLAQVALHQMAGERNPATGVVEVSLEEARQTIEILGMLKEKTKGNLSGEEQRTLEDLLYHLKVEFSRRAAAPRR
ncbi:MAG TPA: DUF1844 domain-containing protein [Candidatus Polarisedimenticolia bacterium]|nr:DUF1844 domain-containing protein [Candidatus Polarisedimenticolia bacterium]